MVRISIFSFVFILSIFSAQTIYASETYQITRIIAICDHGICRDGMVGYPYRLANKEEINALQNRLEISDYGVYELSFWYSQDYGETYEDLLHAEKGCCKKGSLVKLEFDTVEQAVSHYKKQSDYWYNANFFGNFITIIFGVLYIYCAITLFYKHRVLGKGNLFNLKLFKALSVIIPILLSVFFLSLIIIFSLKIGVIIPLMQIGNFIVFIICFEILVFFFYVITRNLYFTRCLYFKK